MSRPALISKGRYYLYCKQTHFALKGDSYTSKVVPCKNILGKIVWNKGSQGFFLQVMRKCERPSEISPPLYSGFLQSRMLGQKTIENSASVLREDSFRLLGGIDGGRKKVPSIAHGGAGTFSYQLPDLSDTSVVGSIPVRSLYASKSFPTNDHQIIRE